MKTILAPVDFSDCAQKVIETATRLVSAFGSRLIILHVAAPEPEFVGYGPGPQTVRDSVAKEFKDEHRRIHALSRELEACGLNATALVIQGYPVDKIIEEAARQQADLIVMGSHGHGLLRNLLVGSVTEGVMRKAECPVLIVPFRST
ncbi:MAG TPA: universal stress protein [Kiritimatiellia bacterium]|nr:universal stress protein [Kiritimatiellia bacterium]